MGFPADEGWPVAVVPSRIPQTHTAPQLAPLVQPPRNPLDLPVTTGVRHAVLSAFGCGAFRNPAHHVARIYRQELQRRAAAFDVIAFGVFHAGYGPNNYEPFVRAFADWPRSGE